MLALAACQVTLELPDGRSVALPVGEKTQGSDVRAYVATLLGQPASRVRLHHARSGRATSASSGRHQLSHARHAPALARGAARSALTGSCSHAVGGACPVPNL